MYRCPPCINLAIPSEYRAIAERLFPLSGFPQGQGPGPLAAADFARTLGIGADYERLLALHKNAGDMRVFLGHFQNNLDLLIQKTWVEKADEVRKEQLQDNIPIFMGLIEQGKVRRALETFGLILEELAYLLFGAQSTKDDFTEYTFRIDSQMGLFWWYGARLGSLKNLSEEAADAETLWAVLLIGICYLTNF
jgi:hypothetical protein